MNIGKSVRKQKKELMEELTRVGINVPKTVSLAILRLLYDREMMGEQSDATIIDFNEDDLVYIMYI